MQRLKVCGIKAHTINESDEFDTEVQKNTFQMLCTFKAKLITSDKAQQGKSYTIEQMSKANDENLIWFSMLGDIDPASLHTQIRNLSREHDKLKKRLRDSKDPRLPKRFALGIRVEMEHESVEQVLLKQQLLFQIVFNECFKISNGHGYLSLREFSHFYIEIGGIHQDFLKRHLGIALLLKEKKYWENPVLHVRNIVSETEAVSDPNASLTDLRIDNSINLFDLGLFRDDIGEEDFEEIFCYLRLVAERYL